MTRTRWIIGGVVVAVLGLALLWFRRRASQSYVDATIRTPQASIAGFGGASGVTLGQLPGIAVQSAVTEIARALPPLVGAGVNSILPQSTPKPSTSTAGAAVGFSGLFSKLAAVGIR